MTDANDSQFENALGALRNKIGDMEINAGSIMTILRYAMEIVELTQVKGTAQKTLAIKLIRHVVVDAPITDEKEKLLLDMIEQDIIGNMIELIVGATRGEFDLNVVAAVAKTCCISICKKNFF